MRSKTILSIASFAIAFAFSTALAGLLGVQFDYLPSYLRNASFRANYDVVTANAIADFVRRDVGNGVERDRRLYRIDEDFQPPFASPSFSRYADVIEDYADASGGMDAGPLPREFQGAWRKHMKAWRDYSDFLNEMKSSRARTSGDAEDELSDLDAQYGADINRTWAEVLRVGRRYGANTYSIQNWPQ